MSRDSQAKGKIKEGKARRGTSTVGLVCKEVRTSHIHGGCAGGHRSILENKHFSNVFLNFLCCHTI